jgi:chorismate mutase
VWARIVALAAIMAMDLLNPKTALDLGNIRYALIRLEDTIIFNLIERAQFPLNPSIYVPGAVPLPDFTGSFLDWLLTEVEQAHGNSIPHKCGPD